MIGPLTTLCGKLEGIYCVNLKKIKSLVLYFFSLKRQDSPPTRQDVLKKIWGEVCLGVSIRSSHMGSLPAELILEGIKFLHKRIPSLPITLCYEGDPNYELEANIAAIKRKISSDKTRFSSSAYTQVDHDRAIYCLLQAAKKHNLSFMLTD